MKHRSDIDGLRSVAILPVLAFHAGVKQLSGGFVGVDVFFVISGFLIGTMILTELDQGRFSIANFYSRRFRRILPALTAVLLAAAVAGAFILYPVRLVEFGRSMIAAALSVSNIYFQLTSGYFDPPSATKPLLHTWSLSVEEQFYLVLPPLLILTRKFFLRHLKLAIIVLAAISFVASAIGAYKATTFTFYELPTRAWELLLGVLVGMYAPPAWRFVREGLVAGGLALIVAAILVFKEGMHFPGAAALLPCVGAAMVIWGGSAGSTLAGRVLSLWPLTFIGLISYSLYLWHWPVIVYYQMLSERPLTAMDTAVVIAVSVVLATLSWRFVERPFRSGAPSRPAVFGTAAVAISACVAAGLFSLATQGLPSRFSPSINRVGAYLDYPWDSFRKGTCFISTGDKFRNFDQAKCLNATADRPNVLLLGDSHAAQLHFGMAQELKGVNVLQATGGGCRPTLARPSDDTPRCAQLMDFMFNQYLPTHRMDMVVLGDRWRASDMADLAATLDWANAHRIPITIAGPIVEYDGALPSLIIAGLRENKPDFPQGHILPEQAPLDRQMAALATAKNFPYASTYAALCTATSCVRVAPDGAPVQFDYGHLTGEGSVLVARRFIEAGVFDRVLPGRAQRPDLAPVTVSSLR